MWDSPDSMDMTSDLDSDLESDPQFQWYDAKVDDTKVDDTNIMEECEKIRDFNVSEYNPGDGARTIMLGDIHGDLEALKYCLTNLVISSSPLIKL